MNQIIWDNLSNQDKYKMLSEGDFRVQKMAAIDGNAKVGEGGACWQFRAMLNDTIILTDWCDTQREAAILGLDTIEEYNNDL